jgi:type IV pilus assembly protein PilM
MTTLLNRIFGKNEKRAVGIDIGSSAIKLVEIYSESGHIHLETYGSVALGPYSDVEIGMATSLSNEKIQDALTKIIQESGCGTREAAVTIPFNTSLVSVIRLPKISEGRLEQIIPNEARKYIPATLEEVMLDWSVIDAQPDIPVDNEEAEDKKTNSKDDKDKENSGQNKKAEEIDVLLAAIHKDSIERYRKIAEGVSLNVSLFEIEVFSTLRAVSPLQSNGPVAIIDIGSASSKIYIIEGGIMRSSHTVNRGSQDITLSVAKTMDISEEEAEMVKRAIGAGGSYIHLQEAVQNVLHRLFSETLKFIETYEKKGGHNLEKVIISGGGSTMKGIKKVAETELTREIQIAKPFDRVKSLPFMKETLARVGPEYTSALGAALRVVGVDN